MLLSHFDTEQDFVRLDIDTEIYSRLPPRCGPLSQKVLMLKKANYGSKQASRRWTWVRAVSFKLLRLQVVRERLERHIKGTGDCVRR